MHLTTSTPTSSIFFFVLFLLGGAVYLGCSGDSDPSPTDAVNYLDRGWSSYEAGDYTQALLSFERAINFDETLADAYNGVGWSHLSLSLTPPLAQEAFQQAVQLDSTNSDAWVGLATLLFLRHDDANDLRTAIRAVDNALQADTSSLYRHDYHSVAALYALKAACYYYLAENGAAQQEVTRALQSDSTNVTARALQKLLDE